MFGLETTVFLLLILCLVAACAFEFVNGFHDTANAVATVIYTNSLLPGPAVVLSGICNFLGVFVGGIGVAMGIVNLLPMEALVDQDVYHNIALIMAILLSAIIWNLGTWYYGLPASSSHTLIGSILGVGLAFSFLPEETGQSFVNWNKASEMGLSLIISPIFGFSMTVFLMFALKKFLNNSIIFKEPKKNKKPPTWIRGILILTCTGVSFSHGANDGQKGVGLMMLILIGILPAYYALDADKNLNGISNQTTQIQSIVRSIDSTFLGVKDKNNLRKIEIECNNIANLSAVNRKNANLTTKEKVKLRNGILVLSKAEGEILKSEDIALSLINKETLEASVLSLKEFTDYAPRWVILIISLSLGIGTMVGWKRIVQTIGEKIGKQHLTYAQGASAELVAATTIGLANVLKLPVSTTHVLSSGIAGSMVASKGVKNLRKDTIRNILLAWVLTLPVTIVLSMVLFLFFRWLL